MTAIRQVRQLRDFMDAQEIAIDNVKLPTPFQVMSDKEMITYASYTLRKMWWMRRDNASWQYWTPTIHSIQSREADQYGDYDRYGHNVYYEPQNSYNQYSHLRTGLSRIASDIVTMNGDALQSSTGQFAGGFGITWADSPEIDMRLQDAPTNHGYNALDYNLSTMNEWSYDRDRPLLRRVNVAMIIGVRHQRAILLSHYNDGRVEYTFEEKDIFSNSQTQAVGFIYNMFADSRYRRLNNGMRIHPGAIWDVAPRWLAHLMPEVESRKESLREIYGER